MAQSLVGYTACQRQDRWRLRPQAQLLERCRATAGRRWDGGLYTALEYLTGAANAEDPGGQLVRRLKAGDPAAPALAARLIPEGSGRP